MPHITPISLIALGKGTCGIVAHQRGLHPWSQMYYQIEHNILKKHSFFSFTNYYLCVYFFNLTWTQIYCIIEIKTVYCVDRLIAFNYLHIRSKILINFLNKYVKLVKYNSFSNANQLSELERELKIDSLRDYEYEIFTQPGLNKTYILAKENYY